MTSGSTSTSCNSKFETLKDGNCVCNHGKPKNKYQACCTHRFEGYDTNGACERKGTCAEWSGDAYRLES